MVALRDALRWITQGAWVQDLPANFHRLGTSQAASNTITFAVAGALGIGIGWGLRNLSAGRAIYATGSNENAARLVGIDSALVTFSVFTITGALAGCAALLNSIRFNQVPSNAGLGMELKAITAVVVGGTAITGGRGSIQGTLLGVIPLGIISPAPTFLGFSAYWERAIQGLIILFAVGFDAVRSRWGRWTATLRNAPRKHWRERWFPNGEWMVLLALLAEIAIFSGVAQNFLTTVNFLEIIRLSVELGLLALAMTPVIITGGSIFPWDR